MPEKEHRFPEQAARLRRLRELLGYTGHGGLARFAEDLGIELQRWWMSETGRAGLGMKVALRIIERWPGLTLDWLYLGDTDGLNMVWLRRLGLMG